MISEQRLDELIKTHANPLELDIGEWQQSKLDAFTELKEARETIQRLSARLQISEGVERSLRKQLGDRGPWEQLLDQFRDKGHRVTVSVEVYDTKGTSKRGHAATFAEAVAQVKEMMENGE